MAAAAVSRIGQLCEKLPAPLATSIPLRDSSEWSIYHALQVKLQKRTANGLWLLGPAWGLVVAVRMVWMGVMPYRA